ncbi:uncharacterized protein MYCFIDRAFT_84020, partial [Pseudocercospora fijiensis CIRAD86]
MTLTIGLQFDQTQLARQAFAYHEAVEAAAPVHNSVSRNQAASGKVSPLQLNVSTNLQLSSEEKHDLEARHSTGTPISPNTNPITPAAPKNSSEDDQTEVRMRDGIYNALAFRSYP